MLLYDRLARIFPSSFTSKVFLVAFCGSHVPLVGMAVWALAQVGPISMQADLLMWGVVATLLGTGATLLALRAILAPIYRMAETMRTFEEQGMVLPLPFHYRDEIGMLMVRTNRLVLHIDQRLAETAVEAETDPLTGIANRRGFERRVERAVAGAVLMIDIDRFKSVNDTMGHAAGDAVLRQVVTVLSSSLRKGDVLARLGGEEFVVHLPETDPAYAMDVGERLRAAVEAGVIVNGRSVTVSVGVAMQGGGSVADALRRADIGTYAAKSAGRNRVMPGPALVVSRAA